MSEEEATTERTRRTRKDYRFRNPTRNQPPTGSKLIRISITTTREDSRLHRTRRRLPTTTKISRRISIATSMLLPTPLGLSSHRGRLLERRYLHPSARMLCRRLPNTLLLPPTHLPPMRSESGNTPPPEMPEGSDWRENGWPPHDRPPDRERSLLILLPAVTSKETRSMRPMIYRMLSLHLLVRAWILQMNHRPIIITRPSGTIRRCCHRPSTLAVGRFLLARHGCRWHHQPPLLLPQHTTSPQVDGANRKDDHPVVPVPPYLPLSTLDLAPVAAAAAADAAGGTGPSHEIAAMQQRHRLHPPWSPRRKSLNSSTAWRITFLPTPRR